MFSISLPSPLLLTCQFLMMWAMTTSQTSTDQIRIDIGTLSGQTVTGIGTEIGTGRTEETIAETGTEIGTHPEGMTENPDTRGTGEIQRGIGISKKYEFVS